MRMLVFLALAAGCTREGIDPGDVNDLDGDGHIATQDCNDEDPDVFPGAVEICDGQDNDCDDDVDEGVQNTFYADADGDGHGGDQFTQEGCAPEEGYSTTRDDCNDVDAEVSPSSTEICDGKDNDCDDDVDEGVTTTFYADGDSDGFGDPRAAEERCEGGTGWVDNGDDCNDADASVSPDAVEVCDDADQDCDGEADEGLDITVYTDADGDGFGEPGSDRVDCEIAVGYADKADDCNDELAAVNPDATEVCNGIDDNCDTVTDEGLLTTFHRDSDEDGFGDADSAREACEQPDGYVADSTDCDDENDVVAPNLSESCDGLDNNCDDAIDEGVERTFFEDLDADGFGNDSVTSLGCVIPSGYSTQGGDCDDGESRANPAATEVCDGLDNNCVNGIDEDGLTTWYLDEDGDGVGGSTSEDACESPSTSHVTAGNDCDDADPLRAPNKAETCDDIDNDCDDAIDENVTVQVYADEDGDGFGDPNAGALRCSDGDGYVDDNTDCLDTDSSSNPDAEEVCDTVDNDCDNDVDEGTQIPLFVDADNDGYGAADAGSGCEAGSGESIRGGDCDDTDDTILPGADDVPGDGIDQDCDGVDPQVPVGQVCFANDATIDLKELVSGELTDTDQDDPGYKLDDYEVVLTGGKSYRINAWSEQVDTVLQVYDENCDLVGRFDQGAGVDDNSDALLTPPQDGVYTLAVSALRSWERGAYRLRIAEGDDSDGCGADGVVGPGEDTRVVLDSGDATDGPGGAYLESYDIWLNGGDAVSLQALSSEVNAYLEVRNPDCSLADSDDGNTDTDNARITFRPSIDGWYTVGVGAADAGETGVVELHVARGRVGYTCFDNAFRAALPKSYTNGDLTSTDDSTGGPFGDGPYWDDYEVVAGAVTGAAVHAASAELGVQVAAYDDTCTLIEDAQSIVDDEHLGSDSRSVWASAGDWAEVLTFVVQGTEDAVEGGFLVDLAPMGPWDTCGVDQRGILERETVHGQLAPSDASGSPHTGQVWDDYEVFMEEGERMYFVADSDEANVGLAVLDESCEVVDFNSRVASQDAISDAAGIAFRAPHTGVFTVAVSAEGSSPTSSADYWLTASPSAFKSTCGEDALPIVPGGTTVSEALDSSLDESGIRVSGGGTYYHDDTSLYLVKGQSVRLSVDSAFDNYLMVLDSDCTVVAENDDRIFLEDLNAQIDFTAQRSGRYTVLVSSFWAEGTGTYTLTSEELSGF